MINSVEYLKAVYEVFRQLYQIDMNDKEISKCFDFQAAERIVYDAEAPSMAIMLDRGDFYGIDTPFGRFQYRFASIMTEEFNTALKKRIISLFEGERIDDLSDFSSLTCLNPEIYSIRRLPWNGKRLSKTKYVSNREGCLTIPELEAILETMNEYLESFDKPVQNNDKKDNRSNIFDILFHKKNNKKKY